MASNIFGRYVWLIDVLLRHKKLTFKEIDNLWRQSEFSYGPDVELPLRTFHNHRNAIAEIFDIEIKCDTNGGYKYYIDSPDQLESDSLRRWLIDSYAMLNQIQSDRKLEGRILFEHIPSGERWLRTITDAIRNRQVLSITHQSFSHNEANIYEVEPYYLKVSKRRWYLLARSPFLSECNRLKNQTDRGNRPENVYRVYALDRISDIQKSGKVFEMDEDFDVENYFRGCCGVITTGEEPIRVVIKAYDRGANYLRTLPLHESQIELTEREEPEACFFQYEICPTFDFYQAVLAQGDQIEVIEPQSIREEMLNFAKNLMAYYSR